MTLDKLAEVIAQTVKGVKPLRPKLRVITTPKPAIFDSITRNSILARIRRLQKEYRLHMLVEQATFNRPGLDCLDDIELSKLLQDMERGRECLVDGVAFDDAGLIRNTVADIPIDWVC